MSEVTLLVRAGRMVAAHDRPSVSNGAVAVDGEKIAVVGTYHELLERHPNAQVIGGAQFLLIPGLIDGHGHGRGLTDFQRGAHSLSTPTSLRRVYPFLSQRAQLSMPAAS